MRSDFIVFPRTGMCVDLMCCPWQEAQVRLLEMHQSQVMISVSSTRKSLGNGSLVEWRPSLCHPRAWDEATRNLMRAIQSGGVWSQRDKHKAGMADTELCPFCGEG